MAKQLPHFQLPAWWRPWMALVLVSGAYLLTRLIGLTAMPVFADEAIYIRWAQLANHESIYWFFSLNDGKPPLFIWLVAASLQLWSDPLWAARFVSVLVGLLQLWVLDRIVISLRGHWQHRLAVAAIVLLAPFWTFHHRMGLMDALLTLCLSISWWGLLRLHQLFEKPLNLKSLSKDAWIQILVWTGVTGLGWGAALWTKTPALFFAPVFVVMAYWPFDVYLKDKQSLLSWKKPQWWLQRTGVFAAAGALGLLAFLLMRLHPAFGSLFGRSTDFTYSVSDVIGLYGQPLLNNLQRVIPWLSRYLRPEVLGLALIALVASRQWKLHVAVWLAALIFMAPLLILGKTLHPRYFLPVAPFIAMSAAFLAVEGWKFIQKQKSQEMMAIFFLLVGFFAIGSLRFLFFHQYDPDQTPFALHDREQYLTEWSSGHGLRQVRDMMIREVAAGNKVTVVTEGSFGTLPDGLLMYFDQRPEIRSLRIEGLAQFPVKYLPDWVLTEAEDHPTWLVVNSHRLELNPDTAPIELIARYPRPYGGPELQVYRIGTKE